MAADGVSTSYAGQVQGEGALPAAADGMEWDGMGWDGPICGDAVLRCCTAGVSDSRAHRAAPPAVDGPPRRPPASPPTETPRGRAGQGRAGLWADGTGWDGMGWDGHVRGYIRKGSRKWNMIFWTDSRRFVVAARPTEAAAGET